MKRYTLTPANVNDYKNDEFYLAIKETEDPDGEFVRYAEMIADGWRQCAKGQRTTQYCGLAEQAVAERNCELLEEIAELRKENRKLRMLAE